MKLFAVLFLLMSWASPLAEARLVDLGYAKHIPTQNITTSSGHGVAVYRNIRFANSPTGNRRFRNPDTRLAPIKGIQDGHYDGKLACISTLPWLFPFPGLAGTTFGTEDCLFLDVYVPEGVQPGDDVPVLHWFVGSAYAFGGKEYFADPIGLFERMFETHGGKFIFVANNYRLGVSGWTYAFDQDMDANVGLQDCLAAAEWTKAYVARFGGDPCRITAMGESAGAGMLYYMSVIQNRPLPFTQAFIASPAAPPRLDVSSRENQLFHMVLQAAGCKDLACLRGLDEAALKEVNTKLINDTDATGGGGDTGPIMGFAVYPDGKLIQEAPLKLLREGKVNPSLERIVLATMANEGMGTSDDENMPAAFPQLVRRIFPGASNGTVASIQSMYRPAVPEQLAWDWTTDVIFACAAFSLAMAAPNKAHVFINSMPPAIHGQDISYYFYPYEGLAPADERVAKQYQSRILDFIHNRSVGGPVFGANQAITNVSSQFDVTRLPQERVARCELINALALNPVNGA